MQIKWPECVDRRDQSKLDGLEFLIGASNKPRYSKNNDPKLYKYPEIKELAIENLKDKKRFYFLRNFSKGILTFQDLKILNEMK